MTGFFLTDFKIDFKIYFTKKDFFMTLIQSLKRS